MGPAGSELLAASLRFSPSLALEHELVSHPNSEEI